MNADNNIELMNLSYLCVLSANICVHTHRKMLKSVKFNEQSEIDMLIEYEKLNSLTFDKQQVIY
jgi:hypothetical protein